MAIFMLQCDSHHVPSAKSYSPSNDISIGLKPSGNMQYCWEYFLADGRYCEFTVFGLWTCVCDELKWLNTKTVSLHHS